MRKLFALLVMALLCFVACESVVTDDNINNDGPGNDSTIVTPHLSVTSDAIIRMTYLGGQATISYTIEEPCEGVELAVVPDVDWIDYQIFSNNIALDIKPNSDSQQRVGVVTLTYGEEVVEVFVEQSGKLAEDEVRLNLLSERKITYPIEKYMRGKSRHIELTSLVRMPLCSAFSCAVSSGFCVIAFPVSSDAP